MKTVTQTSLAIALAVVAACSTNGGPGTQPADPPGFMGFWPALDSLSVGDTVRLYAQTRDSQPVSSWTVSDSRVATIVQTGATPGGGTALVRAVYQGTATVTAARGDSSASGVLVVVSTPSPASLTVTPSLDTAITGSNVSFTATLRDTLGNSVCCHSVSWSVSDSSVALPSSARSTTVTIGTVKPGSTAVVATSAGKSGSAQLVVIAPTPPGPVASVTVGPATATVTIGNCVVYVATLRDARGTLTTGPVTWSVGDPSIAAITPFYFGWNRPPPGSCNHWRVPQGVLIRGLGAGTTLIAATSGGKTGTAQLTVTPPPAPASVALAPTTDTVVVGDSGIGFTATLLDAQGHPLQGSSLSYYRVTWALSDTSVARILVTTLQTATLRALQVGSAILTATSDGITASAHLVVEDIVPVASVTVSPASGMLVAGDSARMFTAILWDAQGRALSGWALSGHSVTWAVSDTSIAHIAYSPNAQMVAVQGLNAGSAVLTATSGAQSGTAQLVVAPSVASVLVTPTSDTLAVGDSLALTATPQDAQGHPLTGRSVTWTVSDTMVAHLGVVSGPTAWVRAVKSGSAVVTATSEAKSGSAPVIVR